MSFCPYVALSTKKLKIIALFCIFFVYFQSSYKEHACASSASNRIDLIAINDKFDER